MLTSSENDSANSTFPSLSQLPEHRRPSPTSARTARVIDMLSPSEILALIRNGAGSPDAELRIVSVREGRHFNEAARMETLRELRSHFPVMYLWLRVDESDEDMAKPAIQAAGAGLWRLSWDHLAKTLERLYEGGWAIFFFADEDSSPLVVPELLPTEPTELTDLIREIGAAAAVVSWYDDVEWLVAFPSQAS